MSEPARPAANPSFARAFLPGLIIGLIVGLVVGAVVPTLLESRAPLGGADMGTPAAHGTQRDARPEERPAQPEATPTPDSPEAPESGGSDVPASGTKTPTP